MTEKKKRVYDSAKTKEVILDAAEELFAEHGYSATRVDSIASLAGYNKSLIYLYFQDKLGLYIGVIKRADQLGNTVFKTLAHDLLIDETVTSDPANFRRLLEQTIRISYQFLLDHPRFLKIFLWESAEGWKTLKSISYSPDDISMFFNLAKAAKGNGLIREDLDAMMFPVLMMNMVIPFLQSYRRISDMINENDEAKWEMSEEKYIDQIVKFVICGIMEQSL
jgi:TetR/AcrR family transcriptional regulator